MKILLDFLPIVIFFVAYKTYGLNYAIIAMIIASLMQILYTRIYQQKFEKMQLITLALLVVFGALTIYINNPIFIMLKVSALYVLFAMALLFSVFSKQTILEKMLAKNISLPTSMWHKLSYIWGVGFIFIAIINYYFADIAINAREIFFNKIQTNKQLIDIDCLQSVAINLCQNAKITEQDWVNFKLFGTLGLTVLFIIITIAFIYPYIKNEKNTSI